MRGALLGIAVPTEVAKSKALHLLQPHSFERPLVSTTWAAWRSGGSSREPRARGTVPGLSPGGLVRGRGGGGALEAEPALARWEEQEQFRPGMLRPGGGSACSLVSDDLAVYC